MYVNPLVLDGERDAISLVQRTLILKTFPGFVALNAEQLATLASICKEVFFSQGDTLIHAGKPVQTYYLVVEGEVSMRWDGTEVQRLGARSAVGGLAALTGERANTQAVATADVIALAVDTDDMGEVFEDNFALTVGVLKAMAGTLRELQMAIGHPVARGQLPAARKRPEKLTLVDKMLILRSSSDIVFDEVEAVSVLAGHCHEKHFRKGDRIWQPGDREDGNWLLFEGQWRCQQPDREPFLPGPGWMLGSHDALTMKPRYYSAEAIRDGRALVFSRDAMLDVLEDYSELAQVMLRAMALGMTALLDELAKMRGSKP